MTEAALATNTILAIGYGGVFALMFLESSFFPFPSEIVMIPAGYFASRGIFNIGWLIVMGTLGSLAGALFNYFLGKTLGRRFLLKFGKYFFLKKEKFLSLEERFNRNGEILTFIGRLLPGVRQYISLLPGITEMSLARFILFTLLGAGIWVSALTFLGLFLGAKQELLRQNLKLVTASLFLLSAVLLVLYIKFKKPKAE